MLVASNKIDNFKQCYLYVQQVQNFVTSYTASDDWDPSPEYGQWRVSSYEEAIHTLGKPLLGG